MLRIWHGEVNTKKVKRINPVCGRIFKTHSIRFFLNKTTETFTLRYYQDDTPYANELVIATECLEHEVRHRVKDWLRDFAEVGLDRVDIEELIEKLSPELSKLVTEKLELPVFVKETKA